MRRGLVARFVFGGLNEGVEVVKSGSCVTYVDLYDDVDVVYNVSDGKVVEGFVLKKPFDVSELSQKLTVDKPCRYEINSSGSISFFDKFSDELFFVIPRPVMWELGDVSSRCFGLYFDVSQEDDYVFYISKVISEEGKRWLASGGRVYPVVVDLGFDALVTRFFGGTGPFSGMLAVVGVAQVPLVLSAALYIPITVIQVLLGPPDPSGVSVTTILGLLGFLLGLVFQLWPAALVVTGAAFARRVGYGESAGSCAISCAGCAGLILIVIVVIIVLVAVVVGATGQSGAPS